MSNIGPEDPEDKLFEILNIFPIQMGTAPGKPGLMTNFSISSFFVKSYSPFNSQSIIENRFAIPLLLLSLQLFE